MSQFCQIRKTFELVVLCLLKKTYHDLVLDHWEKILSTSCSKKHWEEKNYYKNYLKRYAMINDVYIFLIFQSRV